MITHEASPTLLMFCIFILLLCGFAVLSWGKKVTGRGNWLVWAGIIALLAGVGLDTGAFLKEEFKTKLWMVGWIWPRDEKGAITVGVLQDPLGLAMATLAGLVAGAFLMNSGLLLKDTRPEKTYAALAISTAGAALAWNSLTPWLVFAGLTMTILGGFIALGSRWESNGEAAIAARFIGERALGFLLAFIGACILAASRSALFLGPTENWLTEMSDIHSTWIGVGLLISGLFVQLQPFPFLGWIVSSSEIYTPVRTLLCQIFPAWASFALILRLEPQFVSLGLFPGFGWVALCSAVLVIFSGLFQKNWKLGLGSWLAAGFSLSTALLAFSGPFSGLSMLLGVSLGALCFSGVGSSLDAECVQSVSFKKRAQWLKGSLFLGAAGGTGVLGFVSAAGGLRWIIQAINDPGMAAAFAFVLFIFILLGWKLVWNIKNLQIASEASWLTILSLFLWNLMSLGIVWTGTVTGEVVIGAPDRLMSSVFSQFFGPKSAEFTSPNDFISATGLYWGTLFFAFMTAYWTSGRKEDRWVSLAGFMPKTSRFLAYGYGVDEAMQRVMRGLSWFGKSAERLVDDRIWSDLMPRALSSGVKSVSETVTQFDVKLSLSLGSMLRRSVEIPAKILQLIQTGDLRWYLFFALGSGFALLSHFLKI